TDQIRAVGDVAPGISLGVSGRKPGYDLWRQHGDRTAQRREGWIGRRGLMAAGVGARRRNSLAVRPVSRRGGLLGGKVTRGSLTVYGRVSHRRYHPQIISIPETNSPPAASALQRENSEHCGAIVKVLFVSSEIYPLAKTGGLADVSAALPKALAAL